MYLRKVKMSFKLLIPFKLSWQDATSSSGLSQMSVYILRFLAENGGMRWSCCFSVRLSGNPHTVLGALMNCDNDVQSMLLQALVLTPHPQDMKLSYAQA